MSGLLQDARYGLRALVRSPLATVVALATLTIAVGANTAIFSLVDAVLLERPPYANADRMVRLWQASPSFGRNGIATLNYLDWQEQNTVFAGMAAYVTEPVTLSDGNSAIHVPRRRVSPQYFELFGLGPTLGRTFRTDDHEPGRNRVAVVSHALWTSRFGADPHLVGRSIDLDGVPHVVIGVLPPGAFDRMFPQVWSPLTFTPGDMTRDYYWLESVALLRPGLTLAEARAQMDAIAARQAADYPASNRGWGVLIEPYADAIVGAELRRSLYLLLASVALVLAIGCVNVASVMMSRTLARQHEIAVRAALGAGRVRLVKQFLVEAALLSIGGGVLGIALAYGAIAVLRAAIPPLALPAEASIELDWRVLLFAFLISTLNGLAFGLVQALTAARPRLVATLQEAGGYSSSAGRGHRVLRGGLIVAEVALSFVLLTSAALLIKSVLEMRRIDLGFDATNVLGLVLLLPEHLLQDRDALDVYLQEVVNGVQSVPGVSGAALTVSLPLRGVGYGLPFQIAGRPPAEPNSQFCVIKMVDAAYFDVLGLHLRQGRRLNDADRRGTARVAVINESMANAQFPGISPIGQHMLLPEVIAGQRQLGPDQSWEIVGLVADERVTGLESRNNLPGLYLTTMQGPVPPFGQQALVVRGDVDVSLLVKPVLDAVAAVNKDQAVMDVMTLDAIKSTSVATTRLRSTTVAAFAGIALLLTAVGIYGVLASTIAQRTRELGIRAALGASTTRLVTLVLREGLGLSLVGVALGIAGALLVGRVLRTFLFGVGSSDIKTMLEAAAVLITVALLACYLPGKQAAASDPLIAIRARL